MTQYGGVDGSHLRQYIERVERLEEEKKNIMDDIKDVYADAKANGFDTAIMKKVVSIRKMDAEKREEQETLIDLYKHALGMLGSAEISNDNASDTSEEVA